MQQHQLPSFCWPASTPTGRSWKAVEARSQTTDAGFDSGLHLACDWGVPVSCHVVDAGEPLVQDIGVSEGVIDGTGSIGPIPLPEEVWGRGCATWDLDVEATYQQALLDGCQSPPDIFGEIPSELLTPSPACPSNQHQSPGTPRGKAREDRRHEAYTKAYISFSATPSTCSGQRLDLSPAPRDFSDDTRNGEQFIVVPAPLSAQKIWESMDASNRALALQLPLHLVKPKEFKGPLYIEPQGFTHEDTMSEVTSSLNSTLFTEAAARV